MVCLNMGFSNKDKILTENMYIFKGYGAKKLSKEFMNKGWRLRGLNKLLKKAVRNWHDGKMKQQH